MIRWLSRIVRLLGGLVLLAIPVAVVAVLWLLVTLLRYEQVDDEQHLQAKRTYLESIESDLAASPPALRPNILIILFDDLGFGDLGAYGARSIETPQIDQLAAGGLRLESYYAPSSVCTSSRAALLTGRYAPRAGLNIVAFPTGHPMDHALRIAGSPVRLPAEEILLSEILDAAGYETGMVGKWHLGDHASALPLRRGFDRYFGALYSNDMTPFAIYRGEGIEYPAPYDQTRMKADYMREAVDFLDRDREAPFFFYFAHNFPHIPLHTPADDEGRSQAGLYGDVIEGLDDSVGALLEVLQRRGQLENTLILLTSDNGPWYEGSPGAVRGRKNQTWEGGMRVPFIAHWPAQIAPGRVSRAPVVGVDVVPTILALLDLPVPPDRLLDGIDQTELLLSAADPANRTDRIIDYFGPDQLDAIRDGRFKYHRRRGVRMSDLGDRLSVHSAQGPWLFDLELDPAESYDVTRRHPEVARRMAALFAEKQAQIERNPRGWR